MIDHRLGIVVIAAGKGTRMRSALPKVLHPLCGRTMLGHVLAVADALAGSYTIVVLSPEHLDPIRNVFGAQAPYIYTTQHEQLGTGHAVLQARAVLPASTDDVIVLYGDTPLLRAQTVQDLVALRRESNALISLMSFHAYPPLGYGRVLRDAAGFVIGLVEERDATPEQYMVSEGNAGITCFDAAWLWESLDHIPRNPSNGEYYLTDLVALAVAQRGPGAVVAMPAADAREAWGVNNRVQLAQATAVMRERMLEQHMLAGVTIIDPASTYVDVDVTIGCDTTLLPGTRLCGSTQVGARCEIGPATTVVDSTIGDGALVRYALVERARVPAEAVVGPFTHLGGA